LAIEFYFIDRGAKGREARRCVNYVNKGDFLINASLVGGYKMI